MSTSGRSETIVFYGKISWGTSDMSAVERLVFGGSIIRLYMKTWLSPLRSSHIVTSARALSGGPI